MLPENRSQTLVQVVEEGVIQKPLQGGKRDLSVDLDSTPSTVKTAGDSQPRNRVGVGSVDGKWLQADVEGAGILARLTKPESC